MARWEIPSAPRQHEDRGQTNQNMDAMDVSSSICETKHCSAGSNNIYICDPRYQLHPFSFKQDMVFYICHLSSWVGTSFKARVYPAPVGRLPTEYHIIRESGNILTYIETHAKNECFYILPKKGDIEVLISMMKMNEVNTATQDLPGHQVHQL